MARTVIHSLVEEFRLRDVNYTRNAKRITEQTRKFSVQSTRARRGVAKFRDSLKNMGTAFKKAAPFIRAARGALMGLLRAALLAAAALGAVAAATVFFSKQAAGIERLKLGLDAYADSSEEAQSNFERFIEVAKLPGLGVEEALSGAAKLMAVGFDARLAERALKGFGNALALVGGTKEQLFGVITALSKIISKGRIGAEEIESIATNIVQVRELMKLAFGEVDPEKITASGVTVEDFVKGLIDALETLPKAGEGAANAWENLEDAIKLSTFAIGSVINQKLTPILNKLSDSLVLIGDAGILDDIADTFTKIVFGSKEGTDNVESMTLAFVTFAQVVIERGKDIKNTFVDIINVAITAINWLVKLAQVADNIAVITPAGMQDRLRRRADPDLFDIQKVEPIPLIGQDTGENSFFNQFKERLKENQAKLDAEKARQELDERLIGGKDEGPGDFSQRFRDVFGSEADKTEQVLSDIADNTFKTAVSTGRMAGSRSGIIGGGDIGRLGVFPSELGQNRFKRPPTVTIDARKGSDVLAGFITDQVNQVLQQLARQGYFEGQPA